MEAPTVTIKIKGLKAIHALGGKGAAGGVKIKGLAVGKGAAMKVAEVETTRVVATKGGLVMQATEIETHVMAGAKGKAAMGAKTAMVTKGAAAKSAVAGKGAVGTGAALSAKGIGWSLGLGGFGPWLVLGALGLTAAGIYLYLRADQEEELQLDQDPFEAPA